MQKKGQGGGAMWVVIGAVILLVVVVIVALMIAKQSKRSGSALDQLPMLFIFPKYLYHKLRQ